MEGGEGVYEAAYQFVNHNIAETLFDQPYFDYHFAALGLSKNEWNLFYFFFYLIKFRSDIYSAYLYKP